MEEKDFLELAMALSGFGFREEFWPMVYCLAEAVCYVFLFIYSFNGNVDRLWFLINSSFIIVLSKSTKNLKF